MTLQELEGYDDDDDYNTVNSITDYNNTIIVLLVIMYLGQ